MNFFRSVFSDDPDPSTASKTEPQSPKKSSFDEGEESSDPSPRSNPTPVEDAGAWSFGGLIKTLSAKSESVIETYRRDLQEFGSGLKKEIEVAHGSLETVGHAFDEFGSSVLKVHKLKQAEDVRANLVKRAIAREEEEDLSWDVDDDDDEDDNEGYNEMNAGSKGDTVKNDASNEVQGKATKSEEVNVEHATPNVEVDNLQAKEEVGGKEPIEVVKELNGGSSVGDDEKREKSSSVEELEGEKKGSDQKVHLEGGSGSNNKDQGLKPLAVEAKSDHGESSKDSDVSIVSTQPSMPEDEDLGWDEIEDLSIIEEKKGVVTQGGITNREEMRKRLSTAEDDEDLDWGTDTE
ncbi:hypothetical protein IC575_002359 [Cucumis melo]